MTSIEEHKKSIQAFIDDINEKIRAGNIFERQKTVGFDVSEGSTNLFELYLHKKNLITEGFSVNHRFFSSKEKANEKFSFDFPYKDHTINLPVEIENLTTKLCYGKGKKLEEVEKAIKLFFDFKKLIENQIGVEL